MIMYLHLGNDNVINTDNIIGIFDMDETTVTKNSRQFLNEAELSGNIVVAADDLPKSFVVAERGGKTKIYISQMSPSTLQKRISGKGHKSV